MKYTMVEENATFEVQIADHTVIEDLETLKVLADPLRLSILEYLMKPSTVKKIAEKLGKPPTKLYYHFNLLEKHNLIQLVDTRVVSGIIEKHYQATAKQYFVAKDLLAPGNIENDEGLELTLSSIFADAKNDIITSMREGAISAETEAPKHKRMILAQHRLTLTDDQAEELYARMHELFKEFGELSNENDSASIGTPYKTMTILHPSSRYIDEEEVSIENDAILSE